MLTLIHILPLAAGTAVSPALLGASIEILVAFGKRGVRMLLLYLVGAAVVVAGVMTAAGALPQGRSTGGTSVLTDILDTVFGAVLLLLAAVLALRRPSHGGSDRVGRLLSSRWAGMGVLALGAVMMLTNISTLVLILAGVHEVSSDKGGPVLRVVGLGLLAVGAIAPILVPLTWAALRPAAAGGELQRINTFISRHGRVLGAVVCAVTGLYLLARGFGLI